MNRILIVSASLLFATSVYSQSFPAIEAEDLNGKSYQVPAGFNEKPLILGLAFSKDAQKAMRTWITPVYRQFMDDSGLSSMIYDVDTYMLIAFTGAKRAAAKRASKMIKESTEEGFYSQVLLHKGSFKPFRENLKISDKDSFYLFVLSAQGDVMYYVTGRYTEKKFDKIDMVLE